MKLQKNPNVTVRMRGVMEKCTYCVQRIEEAKIAAHVQAGASRNTHIPRDSFTSACAQACPTEAIVFRRCQGSGEPGFAMKKQDRNYRLLEYLNVNTRTSYLARIRNPNPKMPDAAFDRRGQPRGRDHERSTRQHECENGAHENETSKTGGEAGAARMTALSHG